MDDGPYWVILLMYGSHDMRHTGFRRLTVVNGTPGFWGVIEPLISSSSRSAEVGTGVVGSDVLGGPYCMADNVCDIENPYVQMVFDAVEVQFSPI